MFLVLRYNSKAIQGWILKWKEQNLSDCVFYLVLQQKNTMPLGTGVIPNITGSFTNSTKPPTGTEGKSLLKFAGLY